MNPEVILYTDVETTGLDEARPRKDGKPRTLADGDFLLQVAVVPVDADTLEPLGEHYEAVLHYPRLFPEVPLGPASEALAATKPGVVSVEALYAHADDYVRKMHTKTGLWERLSSDEAKSRDIIDAELLLMAHKYAPKRRHAQLGGNSVVLDLNFIRAFLPKFAGWLHYRFIDVTGLAVSMERFGILNRVDRPSRKGEASHEALDDIMGAVDEHVWIKSIIGELVDKANKWDAHVEAEKKARTAARAKAAKARAKAARASGQK